MESRGKRIRKVVIATNIAETSLTIGDVVYVVDSGKLRERHFDTTRGISALVEGWISQVPFYDFVSRSFCFRLRRSKEKDVLVV